MHWCPGPGSGQEGGCWVLGPGRKGASGDTRRGDGGRTWLRFPSCQKTVPSRTETSPSGTLAAFLSLQPGASTRRPGRGDSRSSLPASLISTGRPARRGDAGRGPSRGSRDGPSSPAPWVSGTFVIDRGITMRLAGSQGHPPAGPDGTAAVKSSTSSPRPLERQVGEREGNKTSKINDLMGSSSLIKKRPLSTRVAGKRAVNRGRGLMAGPAACEVRDCLTGGRPSAVLGEGGGRGGRLASGLLRQGGPGDSARLCGEATREGKPPVCTGVRGREKASTTLPLRNVQKGRKVRFPSRRRQASHQWPRGHQAVRLLPRTAWRRPTESTKHFDDGRTVTVLPKQNRGSNAWILKFIMYRLLKVCIKVCQFD